MVEPWAALAGAGAGAEAGAEAEAAPAGVPTQRRYNSYLLGRHNYSLYRQCLQHDEIVW